MSFQKILNYLILSLFLFFFISPFIIYLKNSNNLNEFINFFINFRNLKIYENKYFLSFINSVIISLTTVTLSFIFSIISAYSFVFNRFKYQDFLFIIILTPFMIPEQVLTIPLFLFFVDIGIYDTLLPIVLSHLGNNSIGIFFCFMILKNFPRDIFESAYADGCKDFTIIIKIILPLKYRELIILFLILFYVNINKTIFSYTFIESLQNFTFPIFMRYSGMNVHSIFIILLSLVPAYYLINHLDKFSLSK